MSEPRWLNEDEKVAWLGFVRMLTRLPAALDAQLDRDAGLTFFEYHALSMLSEAPGRVLRMSRLAQITSASLSRLSNVVKRLEARGLVAREPDPDDRRATRAVLTPEGLAQVESAAPRHVETVRALILDALGTEDLERLHEAHEAILARVDPDGVTRPEWL